MEGVYLFGVIFLLLLVLLFLANNKYSKEGFAADDDHDEFSKKYQKKYNRVGAALVATRNEHVLGEDTRGLFGNIEDTLDSSETLIQKISDPYPLEGGRSGMFDTIDKCEAVKSTDCSAFDDPKFSKDCGLCLDVGTNSQNKPATGGLVLIYKDKEYGKSQQKGNFLAPYEPTVGTCPAGKMVATKAECLRLQKQLTCEKNNTFNSPTGCAQCYDDTSYKIVDPESEEGLIVGSGSLVIVGSGTLVFKETGQNNNITTKLSSRPFKIQLLGPEYNTLSFTLNNPAVPVAYNASVIYNIDDLIIFNGTVYRLNEGIGAPGYDPSNPTSGEGGVYPHWENKGSYTSYTPPPAPFIAGYLTGLTANGNFSIDLYRIILSDSQTGRKPRTMDFTTVDGVDCTNMGPGFGKKKMVLTGRSPFTFVDPLSQEAAQCPNSPFVTLESSSNFLQSDPCYTKGSGPGKFSEECLQNLFLNNGCVEAGKGYPSSSSKMASLMFDSNNGALKLNQIADKIYASAIASATGVSANGTQLSIKDWSDQSIFCTGVAITSPCDVASSDAGLNKDCIVYLWDNQGDNKKTGTSYSLIGSAKSLFSKGSTSRFCTRNGTISPVKMDGTVNRENLAYWQKIGDIASVKAVMSKIHSDANSNLLSEDVKTIAIQQCYGLKPGARPSHTSTFKSDTSVQGNPPSQPMVEVYQNCTKNPAERGGVAKYGGGNYNTDSPGFMADASYMVVPKGFRATLFNNKTYDGQSVVVGPGEELNYCSTSWANDSVRSMKIEDLRTASQRNPRAENALAANTVLASDINLPKDFDYTLSFDITPFGIVPDYSSIMRITNTTGMFWNRGDRNPFIAFSPGTTNIYIILGDDTGDTYNWGPGSQGYTFPPLPLNKKSTVSISASGSMVVINVGNTSQTYTQPTSRVYGSNYKLYASDNFFPPANASIENIRYTVNSAVIYKSPPAPIAPVQPFGPGQAL